MSNPWVNPVYTKNPFMLWYAEARYKVGNLISDFMVEHNLTEGFWYPLHYWAYGSEGAYNCLIMPELRKVIRAETKRHFFMYLTQYRDPPGKKPYAGQFKVSIPIIWEVYRRVPFVYNWAKRQSRILWFEEPENKASIQRMADGLAEDSPLREALSVERHRREAYARKNYWKSRKK